MRVFKGVGPYQKEKKSLTSFSLVAELMFLTWTDMIVIVIVIVIVLVLVRDSELLCFWRNGWSVL